MASVLSRIQIIMEANTAKYNNEMRQARENSTTTFSKIGKSASKMALVVGTALAGMGAFSIKSAMSFETAMAEIDKTVDFTSSNGLANMRKELQALTTQIPQTFEELAAVTATGGQLGIAEKDLVHFTEVMAKMGVAFDIPAQQAADSMAKIANVFQIPIANIDRLGDAINTLSNNTPATAAQLIDSLQRVGGVAKVFGLSEDATLGLTGALIAMGKPAEVASTAVNSLLTSFSTLDNATKSQLIGFEQLGLNIDDFSKLVATDGKQAIITYLEAINKLDQSKRIGTNALIIGKEFGDDITMLAGSVGVLENNWAMLGETVNTTKDYFGSMDVEFEKISATSANKMVLFKNNIDGVVASVGEAFIPALNELLLNMTPMVATIGTWVAANPELIQQITLMGGSLVGTILGLKLAVDGFTAAKTTIDGLKLAYAALGTTMGLTTIAIGILILGGLLLYQNWDKVKQVIKDNEPAFIALGIAVGAITTALIAAKAPLILMTAQSWLAAAGTTAASVGAGLWSIAAGVAAAATWTFNAALAVLTSPIILVVAAIATIATMGYLVVKNWGAISAGLKAEFERIKAAVMTAVNGMQSAWNNGIASTRAAFITMGNTISTALRALPGKMLQVGKDVVMGLINGIKSGASGVATAIGSMASSAVAKAKSVLDIRSPSRVMKKVGEQTAQGMADGIKKGKKAVVTEAQKMAADAVKAVQDGVAGLKRELSLFGNDSALSALDYDIGIGKYKGANTDELRNLTQRLELTKELATANDSVQSSIDAMIKKRVLFNNTSEVASLEYDILYTDRFKNASGERVQQLLDETRAVEGLANQLKATNAIKERFAQLEAAQKSAANAFDGLEINQPQTEADKLRAAYENKMAIVNQFEDMHTEKSAQAHAARIKLTEGYNQSIRDMEMQKQAQTVGSIAAMFGMVLGETSKGYRAMFAIQQAYDFVQAQSASFTAIAKAWSSAPFPANIPAVLTTTFQTGIIPAAIKALAPKGFKQGGYTGSGSVNDIAGSVHGKEFVAHAEATRKYRPELEAMNDGSYGKGKSQPVVNMTIENHAGVPVSHRVDNDGRIRVIVGEELNKQMPQHVNDEYSPFNKAMKNNYHLQRNLG